MIIRVCVSPFRVKNEREEEERAYESERERKRERASSSLSSSSSNVLECGDRSHVFGAMYRYIYIAEDRSDGCEMAAWETART